MDKPTNESMSQAEAVYYSVLSLLDELPGNRERELVALNWAKYVLLTRASDVSARSNTTITEAFSILCGHFALNVVNLADMYKKDTHDLAPCGKCDACLERDARRNEPRKEDLQ